MSKRRAAQCTIAPVPPEFADLVVRADAAVAGALTARSDLAAAAARYEASRAWTWEEMAKCGVALARTEPTAQATPLDVLNAAARLLRNVPSSGECGGCRACADALRLGNSARYYVIAVRAVWRILTGRPEW